MRHCKGLEFCFFQEQHPSNLKENDQCQMRKAIQQRKTDLVKKLIHNGVQVNDYSIKFPYQTPLHLAIISRSSEIAKILLDQGANTSLENANEDTPLTLAAKTGNIPMIDLLLSYEVNNHSDAHKLTHLHIACMRNKVNIVHKLLLQNPAEANELSSAVNEDSAFWAGYTALHFAVHYGCTETVRFLLNCGADITRKDAKQMTPLHLADYQRNDEMIDLILAAHNYFLSNPTNAQGLSHFHIACTRSNLQIVKHFLKSGVDVNLEVESSPWTEWRPIHFAIYYNCPAVVELLLNANAYLESSFAYILLKFHIKIGDSKIYDLVSARKKSIVSIQRRYRQLTDFHHACIENDPNKIGRLLSERISVPPDFNIPIWTGCTPAHVAIRCQSIKVVKFLLDCGADFQIQDAEGRTPLHIAFQMRHPIVDRIINRLKSSMQNLADDDGLSILHILCTTNHVKLIEKLLSQGADINAQVGAGSMLWAGFTPLHFASTFYQNDNVALLLKHHADISIRNVLHWTPSDPVIDRLIQHSYVRRYWDMKVSKILITILSSRLKEMKELEIRTIPLLHAFSMSDDTHLADLREYLTLHQVEIDEMTEYPNWHQSHKCTALHLAMQRREFEQAKLLLEKGADPLIVNGNGQTPLECAGSEIGFSIDIPNPENIFFLQTPIETLKPSHFHLACIAGQTNVVKYLLNKVSDEKLSSKFINSLSDNRETPLHSVCSTTIYEASSKQIAHILLENSSDVDAKDYQFQTPLHLAAKYDNLDVMRILINYGADVNAQNLYGQTPLHLVFKSDVHCNKKKLVLLLENGADINIVDERGRTSLMERFIQRLDDDSDDDVEDDSEECYVILLEHFNKLREIGFYINNLNEEAYTELLGFFSESFNQAAFQSKCRSELESMKTMDIDSRTTLYDILLKSPNSMVFYVDNLFLQTLASSREFFEEYPIYGYLIRLRLKNGKTRKPLLIESGKFFVILSRKLLPCICLDVILQYLSDTDLKNIISSTKE